MRVVEAMVILKNSFYSQILGHTMEILSTDYIMALILFCLLLEKCILAWAGTWYVPADCKGQKCKCVVNATYKTQGEEKQEQLKVFGKNSLLLVLDILSYNVSCQNCPCSQLNLIKV